MFADISLSIASRNCFFNTGGMHIIRMTQGGCWLTKAETFLFIKWYIKWRPTSGMAMAVDMVDGVERRVRCRSMSSW